MPKRSFSISALCNSGSPRERCGCCRASWYSVRSGQVAIALARASLPAGPPGEPQQGHVVVARSVFARLRHDGFEVLLGADPQGSYRLPCRLALLRAPEEPGRQRIRSEEEDVVGSENPFAHPHVRTRVVIALFQRADQERARPELFG